MVDPQHFISRRLKITLCLIFHFLMSSKAEDICSILLLLLSRRSFMSILQGELTPSLNINFNYYNYKKSLLLLQSLLLGHKQSTKRLLIGEEQSGRLFQLITKYRKDLKQKPKKKLPWITLFQCCSCWTHLHLLTHPHFLEHREKSFIPLNDDFPKI